MGLNDHSQRPANHPGPASPVTAQQKPTSTNSSNYSKTPAHNGITYGCPAWRQGNIITEVEDGAFKIRITGSIRVDSGRFVSVVVSDFQRLTASDGSDVIGEGQLDSLTLEPKDGADVDLEDLPTNNMSVAISDGSDATVKPVQSITGTVTDGADLTIVGNPTTVDVTTSDGADLHRG